MADSLIIAGIIELLGGGSVSTNAQCMGATFRLAPGFNMSAPQPQQDIVANLILDGERPTGRRSANRTITLPIVIQAPTRAKLAGARELLLQTIDSQQWELKWTRDPESGSPLPTVFDCYRALPTVVTYSMAYERALVSQVSISFQAQPYGRSDAQKSISFSSTVTGGTPPPSPVTIDTYSSVSGSHFTQSAQHIVGPNSAHWSSAGGANGVPFYQKTGLSLDISNRPALSVYVGLGVSGSAYYQFRNGNVSFTLTISDNSGHTQQISTTQYCTSSNNSNVPSWQLVTFNLPVQSGFDYTHVTGYTFTCFNFQYFGTSMTVDTYLDNLTANPVSTGVAASSRGQIYNLFGIIGTARSPLNLQVQQAPVSIAESVTYNTPGSFQHLPEAGVSNLGVAITAPGGNGAQRTTSGQGAGASGGGFTGITSYPCQPGVAITGFVGSASGATDSWWDGTAVGNAQAVAHCGLTPAANATTGASAPAAGFANTGTGVTITVGAAGGTAGAAPGAGGAAGAVGGNGTGAAGGAAGAAGNRVGNAGTAPGGGGAGASSTGTTEAGGAGGNGAVIVSWTRVLTTFQTLIAHRPSPDAPQDLCPFVTAGNGTDPPDNREYSVPSLVAGTLADFDGTYSFVLTNFSWNNNTAPRTVTLTVHQYEYAGGPSYTQSLIRTFTPNTDIRNGIVSMGELTLPGKDVAPDNTTGFYTVSILDSNGSDRFLDVLILDTQGQTVIWSGTTGYTNVYVDEPPTDRDLGRVLGTMFDRNSAISVLDQCNVSGGPLTVYPGDNILLLYCIEGAPAAVASYSPRWQNDRLIL